MSIKRFSIAFSAVLIATIAILAQEASFKIEPSAAQLRQHVSYLASDALDGRRTGTTGANDAARYIAGEFSRLGLKPGMQNGQTPRKLSEAMARYLQTFPYVAAVELGTVNELKFSRSSPPRVGQLRVKDDWMPLGISTNGSFAGSIEFVGFGITAVD